MWSPQLPLCCHQFLFPCPLPASPCRYCILSFSLFHNWILFSRSFTLCLSVSVPGCTEGIRQWQQYSCCSPAVQTGTAEMAVPMLWPAAAPGYTWREEITGGRSTQPLIWTFVSMVLSVKSKLMYSRQYGGWAHEDSFIHGFVSDGLTDPLLMLCPKKQLSRFTCQEFEAGLRNKDTRTKVDRVDLL